MRGPRLRRPRLTYANLTATLALLIATTMGGAYAHHGLIGSAEIKKNAVKSRHIAGKAVKVSDLGRGAVATGKIRNKAVTGAKIAPGARAAVVIRFEHGPHDFAADPSPSFTLPGVTEAQMINSQWTIQLLQEEDVWSVAAGSDGDAPGYLGCCDTDGNASVIFSGMASTGQVDTIRVFQTIPRRSRSMSMVP